MKQCIQRNLFHRLKQDLLAGDKLIVVYGARQVGKTTLSNEVLNVISDEANQSTSYI